MSLTGRTYTNDVGKCPKCTHSDFTDISSVTGHDLSWPSLFLAFCKFVLRGEQLTETICTSTSQAQPSWPDNSIQKHLHHWPCQIQHIKWIQFHMIFIDSQSHELIWQATLCESGSLTMFLVWMPKKKWSHISTTHGLVDWFQTSCFLVSSSGWSLTPVHSANDYPSYK